MALWAAADILDIEVAERIGYSWSEDPGTESFWNAENS